MQTRSRFSPLRLNVKDGSEMTRLPNPRNCSASQTCELPLGLAAGARRERLAELRVVDAELQLRLLDVDPGQSRERVLSEALALVVKRIGALPDPPAEAI